MKKVLWFSRHNLSKAQVTDLQAVLKDEVEVEHVNKTVQNAFELKAEIDSADVLAVVMPIHLQEQLLRIAGEKPVLICRNHRVQRQDGSFEFVHAGWDKLRKIEVIKETLSDHPAPAAGAFR